jgi:hypothetical protein
MVLVDIRDRPSGFDADGLELPEHMFSVFVSF